MTLHDKLEYHYKAFDKTKIEPDPLQFPHRFNDENDIEVMAFIASVFAFGNMKQIISSLNKFLLICNNKPYEFIKKVLCKYQIHTNHLRIDFILRKIYSTFFSC